MRPLLESFITDLRSARNIAKIIHKTYPDYTNMIVHHEVYFKISRELQAEGSYRHILEGFVGSGGVCINCKKLGV